MKLKNLFPLAFVTATISVTQADEFPNWKKWAQIEYGMPKTAVLKILGPPNPPDEGEERPHILEYGTIIKDSLHFPRGLKFKISFNNNQVEGIFNPYEQDYSGTKGPAKLLLLVPADKMVFSHQPRIVDFRWNPWPAGNAQATYKLEIVASSPTRTMTHTTSIPWFATAFDTTGAVRWRVKATAGPRSSSWSEWREFELR